MTERNGRKLLGLAVRCSVVLAVAGLASGCIGLKTPKLAVELPEKYNTPDGMTLDAHNNIIVCCPNFGNDKHPPKIVKITPDDKLVELFTVPLHPQTKKPGPLGIDIGSDGNLYVADNQGFGSKEYKSRLLRIVMKNGRAVKCEPVVVGFVMSNAVACHGDSVYVTETMLDPKVYPLLSGVYRFEISELQGERPIRLERHGKDKHLIARAYTRNKDQQVGANGLGFDKDGNMFFCNFGDAELIKCTLDKNGEVVKQQTFAKGSGMLSCDGLKIHPETGDIYIADFLGNAVHKVDHETGKVWTIAKNGNTDGTGGKLDRCSEVCIRGNSLYVANIDLTMGENVHDIPHTISVIDLDD